jgi:uncharacterized protein YfaS (alpha-2-macroglobulin family)
MTRPLDPSRSYGDFVQVQPDLGHGPAASVRGDELCIAGAGFDSHRFNLVKGLRARSGETLAENADVDFTFGDKPPSIAFAGEGVILPREESDGVGIQSVNVARIGVEVWRVPDRNLVRQQINAPDPIPDGQYDDDETGAEREGRMVWKGSLLVKGPAAQNTTTVFPLGSVLKLMPPGAYVIKAQDVSGGRDYPARHRPLPGAEGLSVGRPEDALRREVRGPGLDRQRRTGTRHPELRPGQGW